MSRLIIKESEQSWSQGKTPGFMQPLKCINTEYSTSFLFSAFSFKQNEDLEIISQSMQNQKDIIDCYNKTAKNYADKYIDELSGKHLDGILLKSFAFENTGSGKLIDLGCGPGQTTRYLFNCGLRDIIGIDISPEMIEIAKSINPQLDFTVADILNLKYPDEFFGSAIAFYSIVHFDYEQIKTAFKEIKRVLINNGQFLFSFHIGDNTVHLDNFLDHQVNIDFYFFETNKIKELLIETGFEIIDIIERQPYEAVEYPSRRAYIWVKNTNRRH